MAPSASTTRRVNLGDLGAHDALQMVSEMLRQRLTKGGFDSRADHITELIAIAQKAIRPHSSSRL